MVKFVYESGVADAGKGPVGLRHAAPSILSTRIALASLLLAVAIYLVPVSNKLGSGFAVALVLPERERLAASVSARVPRAGVEAAPRYFQIFIPSIPDISDSDCYVVENTFPRALYSTKVSGVVSDVYELVLQTVNDGVEIDECSSFGARNSC